VHVFVVFTGVPGLMFTKHSAGIELQVMGFIMLYYNCDSSLNGRCYSNRFVARVGAIDTLRLHSALAFHKGWKDRIVDCCLNTIVDNTS